MDKRVDRVIYATGIAVLLVLIGICSFFTFYFYDLHKNDMGLVELRYQEKANIDYSVLLTDGKYYNGKAARSSFIVELMDSVNSYFNYNLAFSGTVRGEYSYKIKGFLYVNDVTNNRSISSTNVYDTDTHSYQIEGNIINISKDFNVNIKDAVEMFKAVKSTQSNRLSGVLIFDVIISYDVYSYDINKYIKDTRTLSINIPISEYNSDISVTDPVDESNFALSDFEVGKDQIYPLVCLEFIGAIILFIVLIILLARKIEATITNYEQEKAYILSEYEDIIINSNLIDLANKDVIFTKDFESLAKIAYRVNKPINYTEITKDFESVFIVINNDTVYVYKLTNEKD